MEADELIIVGTRSMHEYPGKNKTKHGCATLCTHALGYILSYPGEGSLLGIALICTLSPTFRASTRL